MGAADLSAESVSGDTYASDQTESTDMTRWKKITLGLAAFAPLLMAPTPGGYPSNPTFQSATIVNALTGNTANFAGAVSAASFSGAISGGAISGTTGTFSGAVSGTQFTGNLIGGTLSGTSLTATGGATVSNGSTALVASFSSTNAAGAFICAENSGVQNTCIGSASSLYGAPATDGGIESVGAGTVLRLGSNGRDVLDMNAAGNAAFNAPSGGTTLQITGTANAYSGYIQGSATAGQSYGLAVEAGTNASDVSFLVTNTTNSAQYFTVNGAGSITTNGQTAKGAGTLNAAGLYVNGVAVATNGVRTVFGTWTVGVSTCTAVNTPVGMTCTGNAGANIGSITFSPAFNTAPSCIASPNSSSYVATVTGAPSPTTTAASVVLSVGSNSFYLICSGT